MGLTILTRSHLCPPDPSYGMTQKRDQEEEDKWFPRNDPNLIRTALGLWVGSSCGLTGDIWNLVLDRPLLMGAACQSTDIPPGIFPELNCGLRIILNKLKTITYLGRRRLPTVG